MTTSILKTYDKASEESVHDGILSSVLHFVKSSIPMDECFYSFCLSNNIDAKVIERIKFSNKLPSIDIAILFLSLFGKGLHYRIVDNVLKIEFVYIKDANLQHQKKIELVFNKFFNSYLRAADTTYFEIIKDIVPKEDLGRCFFNEQNTGLRAKLNLMRDIGFLFNLKYEYNDMFLTVSFPVK